MVTGARHTAGQRREDVLEAALDEFAQHGLYGGSTDRIAHRAGISQPYLFRLFGSKKELYLASAELCLERTLETFRLAAAGKTGDEAMTAIGAAYGELIESDRRMLTAQLQAYAASDDPDIRDRLLSLGRLPARGLRGGGLGCRAGAAGRLLRPRHALQRRRGPRPDRVERDVGEATRGRLRDGGVVLSFFFPE